MTKHAAQEEQVAENPRFAAMKGIVQSRLNEVSESGQSLKEVMEEQGVEFADPDAEIAPDIKDSDTGALQLGSKEHTVDITSDTFEPERNADGVQEAQEQKTEDTKTPPVEEPPAEVEIPPAEATPQEPASPSEPVYRKEDGKLYTKIKVSGEDVEVELDKLKASAQKDNASRQRFEAAARKEQELAEREAAIAAREALSTTQPAPAAQPQAAPQPAQDVGDTVDELYDSLAYDDEATVKAKLAQVLAGQAQPTSAPEDGRAESSTQQPADIQAEIEAALERKAMKDWEVARQAALAQWEIDFADVAQDTELREVANFRTRQLANAHPEMMLTDVMNQAGEFARNWRDMQNPQPSTPAVNVDSTSRTQAKRQAPAPVKTNSAAVPKQSADDKPLSRSEVVAGIRASRGQPAG